MAFHVNPKNGEISICKAQKKCPFGDLETEHFISFKAAEEFFAKKQPPAKPFKKMSKISKHWDDFITSQKLDKAVSENGFFDVTAQEWKNITNHEPRLSFNFTSYNSLPTPLKDRDWSILSISRNTYRIGPFQAYSDAVETNHESFEFKKPDLLSINLEPITNEDQAITIAEHSGMIHKIVGIDPSEKIMGVNPGRFGASPFSYYIKNNSGVLVEILNENPQIEIDGQFETDDKILIIEAKNVKVNRFLTRQLYIPYRHQIELKKKLNHKKEIIPIFLEQNKGKFNFFVSEFENDNEQSSLKIKKSFTFTLK